MMASFIALVVCGGVAVLGSYVWGVQAPGVGSALWGGVPETLRPLYTINMFLAAAGFFPFTFHVLRILGDTRRPAQADDGLRRRLHLWYGLILVASALWLPLTAWMLASPSGLLWAAVRFDLALVAVGALGLLSDVIRGPRFGRLPWLAAVVGLVPFCIQTVVLDALIWPWFFTLPVSSDGGLG